MYHKPFICNYKKRYFKSTVFHITYRGKHCVNKNCITRISIIYKYYVLNLQGGLHLNSNHGFKKITILLTVTWQKKQYVFPTTKLALLSKMKFVLCIIIYYNNYMLSHLYIYAWVSQWSVLFLCPWLCRINSR